MTARARTPQRPRLQMLDVQMWWRCPGRCRRLWTDWTWAGATRAWRTCPACLTFVTIDVAAAAEPPRHPENFRVLPDPPRHLAHRWGSGI